MPIVSVIAITDTKTIWKDVVFAGKYFVISVLWLLALVRGDFLEFRWCQSGEALESVEK
jgi:hypothetical protein